MRFSTLVSCAALAAPALGELARRASSTFSIYAYGEGLGGLPVFAVGDLAYTGDIGDASNATAIYFTKDTDDSTKWIAQPNTTLSNTTSFDQATLYIPDSSSSSQQVGFAEDDSDAPDGASTSGFLLYGQYVMYKGDSGLNTLWYAIETDDASVWKLAWNATDGIQVSLKTNPPSNANGPRPTGNA